MTVKFLEAGSDATFGTQFYTPIVGAGNLTSDGAVSHTGPRSIKVVSDANANNPVFSAGGTGKLADAGSRASGYVRFVTFPSTTASFFLVLNAGAGGIYDIQVSSAGVLTVLINGVSKTGSTLSTGIWNRISFAHLISAGNNYTVKVFLNGVLDITMTQADATLLNTGASQWRIGWRLATGTGTYNVDDVYVDDGATLDDPGNICVKATLPASVNTGNFDTTVGTGAVNERPLSETNGMEDTDVGGDQQNYTLETASAGDVDLTGATLVARSAWIWAKVSAASVAAKLMDNGSESDVALTTTSALYTLLTDSASYPSNAAGIGMRSSTTPNTFLYECGMLIAYIPGAAGGGRRWLLGARVP